MPNIGTCVHAQSCPTLCSSMDCSPLGSSVILARCCKTYNDLFHSWAVSQSSQMISPRKGSKGQEHNWNFCFQVQCVSHLSNFRLDLSIQCFSLLCSTQKAFLLRYPRCNRISLPKTEFLIQIYMTLGTLLSTKHMKLSALDTSGGGLVVSHTFHIPVAVETENERNNAGRSWWFWRRPWKSCDCLMNQVTWHYFP